MMQTTLFDVLLKAVKGRVANLFRYIPKSGHYIYIYVNVSDSALS